MATEEGYRSGGPIPTCPECLEEFQDPRKLALHLERHRPVDGPLLKKRSQELLTQPCPKDCGRHFRGSRDYREHTLLCTGEKPIPHWEATRLRAIREAAARKKTMAVRGDATKEVIPMVTCPKCDKECADERGLSAHMRSHKGKKPRAAKKGKRRGPKPKGARTTKGLGQSLRDKAEEYREKADRLEAIADELDQL